MSEIQHIDNDMFSMLKEAMDDEFQSLVDIFLADAENDLQSLEMAVNGNNIAKTKYYSHKIKGSALNLAATHFSEMAAKIEAASTNPEQKDVSEYADAVQKMKQEFEYLKQWLSENI